MPSRVVGGGRQNEAENIEEDKNAMRENLCACVTWQHMDSHTELWVDLHTAMDQWAGGEAEGGAVCSLTALVHCTRGSDFAAP